MTKQAIYDYRIWFRWKEPMPHAPQAQIFQSLCIKATCSKDAIRIATDFVRYRFSNDLEFHAIETADIPEAGELVRVKHVPWEEIPPAEGQATP